MSNTDNTVRRVRRDGTLGPDLSLYPKVTLACGRKIYIDANGMFDGWWVPWHRNHGNKRRIDYPLPPPRQEEIELVRRWIREENLQHSKRYEDNSYSLKHSAEVWADSYASNGAAIVAFALEGFRQRRIDNYHRGVMNTAVAVTRKSVNASEARGRGAMNSRS